MLDIIYNETISTIEKNPGDLEKIEKIIKTMVEKSEPNIIPDLVYRIVTTKPKLFNDALFFAIEGCIDSRKGEAVISNIVDKLIEKCPGRIYDIIYEYVYIYSNYEGLEKKIAEKIWNIVDNNPNDISDIFKSAIIGYSDSVDDTDMNISSLIIELLQDVENPQETKIILDNAINFIMEEKKNPDYLYSVMAPILDKLNDAMACNIAVSGIIGAHYKNSLDPYQTISKLLSSSKKVAIPNTITSIINSSIENNVSDDNIFDLVSRLIDEYPEYAENIISGFIHSSISYNREKSINRILIKVFQKNPDFLKNIASIYSKNANLELLTGLYSDIFKEERRNLKKILDLYVERNEIAEMKSFTHNAIKNEPNEKYRITDYAVLACMKKGLVKEGAEIISEIAKNNPDKADRIKEFAIKNLSANGISQDSILNLISEFILMQNPDEIENITQAIIKKYISDNPTDEDLYKLVLKVFDMNQDKKFSNFINTLETAVAFSSNAEEASKKILGLLSKLNSNIGEGMDYINFVIMTKISKKYLQNPITSDNITKILESIDILYSKAANSTEKISKAKSIAAYLTLAKYYFNLFKNKTEPDREGKAKILELVNEACQKTYKSLSEISFATLNRLFNSYFKNKFKDKGVGGETDFPTFPKLLIDRATSSRDRVNDKFNRESFKEISFLNEYEINENKELTREDFFKSINLTRDDFGAKKPNEKTYKLVRCGFFQHAFILAIDTSIPWEQAINDNIDSIVMIDSSRAVKSKCDRNKIPAHLVKFFSGIKTISDRYQKNGTCWANAISGISTICEKCNTFEDILTGFGYQIEGEKVAENTASHLKPLQDKIILDVTETFLPLVSKKYEELSRPSTPTEGEEYEMPSRPSSPRSQPITLGEESGIKLDVDPIDLFNNSTMVIKVLKELTDRAAEYEEKSTRLSQRRILKIKVQNKSKLWQDVAIAKAGRRHICMRYS